MLALRRIREPEQPEPPFPGCRQHTVLAAACCTDTMLQTCSSKRGAGRGRSELSDAKQGGISNLKSAPPRWAQPRLTT
jgi:hypothetical protein